MTTEIARVSIVYRGYDADRSEIDVVEAGRSIAGMGRIYNSIFHTYLHGEAPAHWNYRPIVRAYVGVPRQGSLEWIFVAAIIHSQIAAYPEALFKAADWFIPEFIKSVIFERLGKSKSMEKALDTIQELASANTDLAKTAIADAARDKDRLYELTHKLVELNHHAMVDMASPIQARTCKTITHFDGSERFTKLDEKDAEILSEQDDTEIESSQKFNVVVKGVDTVTGSCRVQFTDNGQEIRGKINDPALQKIHNPYTLSLDNQEPILITAKPELREGEMIKLHISDAEQR